jgi:hypothetical protein
VSGREVKIKKEKERGRERRGRRAAEGKEKRTLERKESKKHLSLKQNGSGRITSSFSKFF